jgi:glycine hydroxymethyltransferase
MRLAYTNILLEAELRRRNDSLTLIASEWAMAGHIRDALSSVFAEKYFEGTPSNESLERLLEAGLVRPDLVRLRKPGWYAPGCELYDDLSWLSQSTALDLFDRERRCTYYVDNRVLSGSQANQSVALTVMRRSRKNRLSILCLDMDHGGHLSHGLKANIAGLLHDIHSYKFEPETQRLDYDALESQVDALRPDILIYGGSACPRDWDHVRMVEIVARCPETHLLFDGSHPAGLIAAGLNGNPFTAGVQFISMTTNKTLCGPRGALVACLPEFAESLARSVFPGLTAGPHGHEIYAKVIAYQYAAGDEFRQLMERVASNARTLATALREDHGVVLVTGGTDTHMVLIDLARTCPGRDISGLQVEVWAEKCGVYMNRNTVPYDPKPAQNATSGLRVGVGVVSQRGMGSAEMRKLATIVARLVYRGDDARERSIVTRSVSELISSNPFPPTYA